MEGRTVKEEYFLMAELLLLPLPADGREEQLLLLLLRGGDLHAIHRRPPRLPAPPLFFLPFLFCRWAGGVTRLLEGVARPALAELYEAGEPLVLMGASPEEDFFLVGDGLAGGDEERGGERDGMEGGERGGVQGGERDWAGKPRPGGGVVLRGRGWGGVQGSVCTSLSRQ